MHYKVKPSMPLQNLPRLEGLLPTIVYSSITRLRAIGFGGIPNYFCVPKIQTLLETTYFAGLRKAGVPEE
jgi:hypothetical protein